MAKPNDISTLTFEPMAYSVEQTASLLGLSRSVLYRLMEDGKLTYSKIRRRRLIPRHAIERLLAEHEVRGEPRLKLRASAAQQ